MADTIIDIGYKDAIFYNPDKYDPNRLVLRFPNSVSPVLPEGIRIKFTENKGSDTEVKFLAQGSDTIENPLQLTNYAASVLTTIPFIRIEYMLVGTKWQICDISPLPLNKFSIKTIAFADTPFTLDGSIGMLLVNASGGNVVVNTPLAAGYFGTEFSIKKIDSSTNTVTVSAGTEDIDEDSSVIITTQWASITIKSDGSNYYLK